MPKIIKTKTKKAKITPSQTKPHFHGFRASNYTNRKSWRLNSSKFGPHPMVDQNIKFKTFFKLRWPPKTGIPSLNGTGRGVGKSPKILWTRSNQTWVWEVGALKFMFWSWAPTTSEMVILQPMSVVSSSKFWGILGKFPIAEWLLLASCLLSRMTSRTRKHLGNVASKFNSWSKQSTGAMLRSSRCGIGSRILGRSCSHFFEGMASISTLLGLKSMLKLFGTISGCFQELTNMWWGLGFFVVLFFFIREFGSRILYKTSAAALGKLKIRALFLSAMGDVHVKSR